MFILIRSKKTIISCEICSLLKRKTKSQQISRLLRKKLETELSSNSNWVAAESEPFGAQSFCVQPDAVSPHPKLRAKGRVQRTDTHTTSILCLQPRQVLGPAFPTGWRPLLGTLGHGAHRRWSEYSLVQGPAQCQQKRG